MVQSSRHIDVSDNIHKIVLFLSDLPLHVLYELFVRVIDMDACKSRPCQNGGNCRATANGYECKCNGNFRGLTCARRYYTATVTYMTSSTDTRLRMHLHTYIHKKKY